ncbi:hypothetical protein NDU88_005139 [Pleurodeles waltl]|uniref:UPAR/Ly6 domain-containing protein n=1 Tax=Pleurodeles waltl TaxID=8319 RepID=A0AAV7V746_PLEWA|nr:hypothetical protein NDU88_005139 [Pleurodeles waltl]
MQAVVPSLLAAALLLGTVDSLRCYTCLTQTSNAECLKPADCPTGNFFCETFISKNPHGVSVISKTCQSLCHEASEALSSTTCCKTDLCNESGANSVRISYTVISLAMVVCALLLRAGL